MTTNQTSQVIQQLRQVIFAHDGAGLTDGQLLGCFIEHRDEAAFGALVRRHGPMVWAVCRRLLPHHDAEDAFQATFLVLVRKAAAVVPRTMVANFLYGVARQTALLSRRSAARRGTRERQVKQVAEPAALEPDSWHDLEPLLDQELARLPDKYRVAIVLCDLEGMTRKEAARQLGCPEGTVAARLARGRALLAKRLSRHGIVVAGSATAAVLVQQAASACVPASVVAATVRAACLMAAGPTAAGTVSGTAIALTEGVLKTMLLNKLKTAVALTLMAAVIVLGIGGAGYYGFAQQPANDTGKATAQPAPAAPPRKDAEVPQPRGKPHYCWLAFGPKAQVRALFRVQGEEVAIDRDGDGKFDGKGERFKSEKDCKDVVFTDPDGKTSYVVTYVSDLQVVPPEKFMEIRVNIRGPYSYPQCGLVQMADSPKKAPQVLFHGPLKVASQGWQLDNRSKRLVPRELMYLGAAFPKSLTALADQSLKTLAGNGLFLESMLPKHLNRAGAPSKLFTSIQVAGDNGLLGVSSFVAVCSPATDDKGRREQAPFPKGIHPFADVEFPAKKPGAPALVKRYALDQFCCDGLYCGAVRVPDEAGAGKAKVTFSFAAWKEANVASTSVEIPIEDGRGAK